jgi:hypothetical protein
MEDRLAALEDGIALRSTLEEFDGLERSRALPVPASSVALVVDSVRLHESAAEVELFVTAAGVMITGWSGVAHEVDGRWVVARSTFCTLLGEWTSVRCPGYKPQELGIALLPEVAPRRARGDTVLPLTFADGGRGDLVLPRGLAGGWVAQPHAELRVDGAAVRTWFSQGATAIQQPVIEYRGAPGRGEVVLDAMNGLAIRLGKWTAFVPAENLTEEQRRNVARHLTGYTTKSGFPVLTPTQPLRFRDPPVAPAAGTARLVKSALNVDAAANPVELVRSSDESYTTIVVTPGPCPETLQPSYSYEDYLAEERCQADGTARIAVEGDPALVTRLLDEVRLVRYRPPPRMADV